MTEQTRAAACWLLFSLVQRIQKRKERIRDTLKSLQELLP